MIRSFEPGEEWFYDYRSNKFFEGPAPAAPEIIRRPACTGAVRGGAADWQNTSNNVPGGADVTYRE